MQHLAAHCALKGTRKEVSGPGVVPSSSQKDKRTGNEPSAKGRHGAALWNAIWLLQDKEMRHFWWLPPPQKKKQLFMQQSGWSISGGPELPQKPTTKPQTEPKPNQTNMMDCNKRWKSELILPMTIKTLKTWVITSLVQTAGGSTFSAWCDSVRKLINNTTKLDSYEHTLGKGETTDSRTWTPILVPDWETARKQREEGKRCYPENCITCLQVTGNSEANHLGHLWISDLTSLAQDGEGIPTGSSQKGTARPGPPALRQMWSERPLPSSPQNLSCRTSIKQTPKSSFCQFCNRLRISENQRG